MCMICSGNVQEFEMLGKALYCSKYYRRWLRDVEKLCGRQKDFPDVLTQLPLTLVRVTLEYDIQCVDVVCLKKY